MRLTSRYVCGHAQYSLTRVFVNVVFSPPILGQVFYFPLTSCAFRISQQINVCMSCVPSPKLVQLWHTDICDVFVSIHVHFALTGYMFVHHYFSLPDLKGL